ncbi:hypothetical protein ACVWQG_05730 [Neisseria meningitidis]
MMTESHGYLSNNLPVKIINDIIYATQLVEDLVLGKIKIVDFLKSYNNFYCWLGFDELPQSEKIKFLSYLNILMRLKLKNYDCSDFDLEDFPQDKLE